MIEALGEADFVQHRRGGFARFGGLRAPDQERHRHVLERGELHQQVVELVDESQRAVAYLPPLRVGKTVSGSAEHVDRSRSRVVEAPEQV